ncbi:efflux transporter outer membrane subunit [Rhodanobacter sp. L36]|uniref:efflux transporter outer membrane subunit n=1 Tax=Rhodanobacter sp. L36 TaxID=1747221 RepID=UPI001C20811E|nr:efflux transporter outer membrane subunit [Rhodanobacter sp. L36]
MKQADAASIDEEGADLSAGAALRCARGFFAMSMLLLAGCTVGPDFHKPAAPNVTGYTAHPLPTTITGANVDAGETQHFIDGRDIPADWWTLFHSKPLNDLVERALANSPDLKAAQAALTAAHENMLAQRGSYFPNVSAGIAASREQDPPGSLAPVPSNNAFLYNLYTPQLSISYAPDVFGLNRRTVESLKAQEASTRFQMIAARITLSANVVAAAVQQASLKAQIDATRELVDINTNMVRILRYQLAKGYVGQLDVSAQESQLAQAQATLPPLLKQLAQQNDLIAVLAGRFPGDAPDQSFELSNIALPRELPVSLPSTLVAQRPDVRQAEENMHAASAQIGVAVANRLPNISLTANAGSTALAISQVFKSGTGFWNIGAGITAPIFQGGTLLHEERAAKANYVQAAEQYRSTVLGAFQNVADSLVALQQDGDGVKSAADAADAAKVTLDLSQRQSQVGYGNYLSVLTAQQAWQQARIALIQAQASRLADTAALFQALGGGWWNRTDSSRDTDGK